MGSGAYSSATITTGVGRSAIAESNMQSFGEANSIEASFPSPQSPCQPVTNTPASSSYSSSRRTPPHNRVAKLGLKFRPGKTSPIAISEKRISVNVQSTPFNTPSPIPSPIVCAELKKKKNPVHYRYSVVNRSRPLRSFSNHKRTAVNKNKAIGVVKSNNISCSRSLSFTASSSHNANNTGSSNMETKTKSKHLESKLHKVGSITSAATSPQFEQQQQQQQQQQQTVFKEDTCGQLSPPLHYSEYKEKSPWRRTSASEGLNGFSVEETLCQTVMGSVKKCYRISDGLECILKVSRVNRGPRDSTIENPAMEVEALKKLGSCHDSKIVAHSNIIRLVHHVERPGAVWAVMEYATAGELFDFVSAQGALKEAEARDILRQCAGAVAFMHERGIAHLDLSLENILMHRTYDGKVIPKIIDFGMSQEIKKLPPRCSSPPSSPTSSNAGAVNVSSSGATVPSSLKTNSVSTASPCGGFHHQHQHHHNHHHLHDASVRRPGKPSYMAPEIYAGDKFNPQKADAFSLGVVHFVMLTGVPPFRLATPHDKRFKFVVGSEKRIHRICEKWKRPITKESARFLAKLVSYATNRLTVQEMVKTDYMITASNNNSSKPHILGGGEGEGVGEGGRGK